MKILITGATGFIGQRLSALLVEKGHDLTVLTRDVESTKTRFGFPCRAFAWNPTKELPPRDAFEGIEAVIHLLGESVAAGRWTEIRKKAMTESRVLSTKNLWDAIELYGVKSLKTFIGAAAIGIYGNRGDETLNEESTAGSGFLAELCQAWEAALLEENVNREVRKVAVRIGIVLDPFEGALAKMLPVFKLSMGASLGGGQQWMSWIAIDDLINVFVTALENKNFTGVYNAVSPGPVTNQEFTQKLAKKLNRITLPSAPGFVLKAAMGEMSQLLLWGQKVLPTRLLEQGFQFKYTKLEEAFDSMPLNGDEELFRDQTFIHAPIKEVFSFFSEAKNLEVMTPDWLNFKILDQSHTHIQKGFKIRYRLRFKGVPIGWRTHIADWSPPSSFVDIQESGPFKKWEHLHEFKELAGGTLMTDIVRYRAPFRFPVGSDIQSIFKFRKDAITKVFPLR